MDSFKTGISSNKSDIFTRSKIEYTADEIVTTRDTSKDTPEDEYNSDIAELQKLADYDEYDLAKIADTTESCKVQKITRSLGKVEEKNIPGTADLHTKNVLYNYLVKLSNTGDLEVYSATKVYDKEVFKTKRYGFFETIMYGNGCKVYNYTKHGEELVISFENDSCIGIFEVNKKVYLITTSEKQFKLYRLIRYTKKFVLENIVSAYNAEFKCYGTLGNNIYIVTELGVMMCDTDTNELSLVIEFKQPENFTNITLFDGRSNCEDTAFLGGLGQFATVDLLLNKIKYYTLLNKENIGNRIYSNGVKLLDIWDEVVKAEY